MAFSGTEHLEVCGWNPVCNAVLGNYILSVSNRGTVPAGSTLPASTHSIFNTSTGTARIFTGLDGYNKTPHGAVGYAGRFWVGQHDAGLVGDPAFASIDPATGAVTVYPDRNADVVEAAAGRVFLLNSSGPGAYVFDIGSDAFIADMVTSMLSSLFGVASANDDTVLVSSNGSSGTGIYRFDATATPPVYVDATPSPSGIPQGRGSQVGDHVYFHCSSPKGLVRYHVPTGAVDVVPATPVGMPSLQHAHMTLGPDGNFYGITTPVPNRMVVMDPSTQAWLVDDLPTTRGRRTGIPVSAAGRIWVPTGEPLG